MTIIVQRLLPGEDLKLRISEIIKACQVKAGVVLSSVGSLRTLNLRLANQQPRQVIEGSFEIISLNGTLCENGMHLHLAVADSEGKAFGGHLLDGCLIHTTCELVIGILPSTVFSRVHDEKTGYQELQVKN